MVEGAVTLRGTVETAEAKAEAERLAKETDGVTKVVDQLKVVPAKGHHDQCEFQNRIDEG